MKNFFTSVWEYIRYTKIGKLFLSLALWVITLCLANIWDVLFYVSWIFMIYPLGLFCVMMAYAWVINPINDWKENKKVKEAAKTEITNKLWENASKTAEKIAEPAPQAKVETPVIETPPVIEESAPVVKKKRGPSKKKK